MNSFPENFRHRIINSYYDKVSQFPYNIDLKTCRHSWSNSKHIVYFITEDVTDNFEGSTQK